MKIIEEKGIKIVILQGIEAVTHGSNYFEAVLVVREPLMCPNYVYVLKNRYGNSQVMWTEDTFNIEKDRIIERYGKNPAKEELIWNGQICLCASGEYSIIFRDNLFHIYLYHENERYERYIGNERTLDEAKDTVRKLEEIKNDFRH